MTKRSRAWVRALLCCGIALWAALGTAARAHAAVIIVNTTDDELNVDGDCSLREAIEAANGDAVVDSCPAGSGTDTVDVPPGIFTVTAAMAASAVVISDDLVLRGAGPAATIIQAAGAPGTATQRGLSKSIQAPPSSSRA